MIAMRKYKIGQFLSGGLITNYYCTSRCRHCLYNCSPKWPKDYIDAQTAMHALTVIRDKGCRAVHIGGGEPLLRPHQLADVLESATRMGVAVEYVETNCAWFKDPESALDLLSGLKKSGLKTLLVSISPFHNETVPFFKTQGVLEACHRAVVGVIPWSADFVKDLSAFASGRPHAFEEFEARFGSRYLQAVLKRYWIHMGGRALELFRPIVALKSAEHILQTNRGGCATELTDTTHFHVDLFGHYIPGLCAGLAIKAADLNRWLHPDDYPILTRLYRSGIRGLVDYARSRGFKPLKAGYVNKCDLCTEIRVFLFENSDAGQDELKPEGFYRHR